MHSPQNRPVFLNLFRIRQPVTAVLSILHRLTGVLMVLLIPGLVYLLDRSLSSPQGFAEVSRLLDSGVVRVFGVLLTWVFAHHLLAGLRFLLLDFDVGLNKAAARKTAWLVHGGALLLTIIVVLTIGRPF